MRFLTLFLTFSLIPVILTNSDTNLDQTKQFLRSWLPWLTIPEDSEVRSAPENDTKSKDVIGELLETIGNSTNLAKNETEIDAPPYLTKMPSSPLDDWKNFERSDASDSDFLTNFHKLDDCSRDCSSDLQGALSIVLQEMSHIERYNRLCQKYEDARQCIKNDKTCDEQNNGMFEMITSGFHYMCVEQKLAFNATIQCIDAESGLVQSECENQCQTKLLFMNWLMRSTMKDTIQQGVNGIVGAATGSNPLPLAGLFKAEPQANWAEFLNMNPPAESSVNPQQSFNEFRQFTNDLCRVGDCMLDCIRSKFNTRCEGSAGTLLSEVFVRPIAASQNKLTMLRPVLGMFMPEQCSYVYSNSDLKKHRIDSTMDSELKRMYTEKLEKEISERALQDAKIAESVPLDRNGVPIPQLAGQSNRSPLDASVRTLDEMILELYSRNDSKYINKKLNIENSTDYRAGISENEGSGSGIEMEGSGSGSEKNGEEVDSISNEGSGSGILEDIRERSIEGVQNNTKSALEARSSDNSKSSVELFKSGDENGSGSGDAGGNEQDGSGEGIEGSGSRAEERRNEVRSTNQYESEDQGSGSKISNDGSGSGSGDEAKSDRGTLETVNSEEGYGTAGGSGVGFVPEFTEDEILPSS